LFFCTYINFACTSCLSKVDEVQIKNQWQGECIFNSFASNQRGVAIFFKNNFEFKINQVKKDDNGNLLVRQENLLRTGYNSLKGSTKL
jgi:hypothetical protein